MLRAAFPDLEITIDDQIAESDQVCFRATTRGTHQGEIFGIPATGKVLVRV
jgi:predicted ester cyclase